jgi:hypothetical protein
MFIVFIQTFNKFIVDEFRSLLMLLLCWFTSFLTDSINYIMCTGMGGVWTVT